MSDTVEVQSGKELNAEELVEQFNLDMIAIASGEPLSETDDERLIRARELHVLHIIETRDRLSTTVADRPVKKTNAREHKVDDSFLDQDNGVYTGLRRNMFEVFRKLPIGTWLSIDEIYETLKAEGKVTLGNANKESYMTRMRTELNDLSYKSHRGVNDHTRLSFRLEIRDMQHEDFERRYPGKRKGNVGKMPYVYGITWFA
jgi:hypothetical protein